MVTLTDDQRQFLKQDLELLDYVAKNFRSTVEKFAFPNAYDEISALIVKQKDAVTQLMETGSINYDMQQLALDRQQMLTKPHLENLAFIAKNAQDISDPDEQKRFFMERQEAAHMLMSNTQAIVSVTDQLTWILSGKLRFASAKDSGKAPGWEK